MIKPPAASFPQEISSNEMKPVIDTGAVIAFLPASMNGNKNVFHDRIMHRMMVILMPGIASGNNTRKKA